MMYEEFINLTQESVRLVDYAFYTEVIEPIYRDGIFKDKVEFCDFYTALCENLNESVKFDVLENIAKSIDIAAKNAVEVELEKAKRNAPKRLKVFRCLIDDPQNDNVTIEYVVDTKKQKAEEIINETLSNSEVKSRKLISIEKVPAEKKRAKVLLTEKLLQLNELLPEEV